MHTLEAQPLTDNDDYQQEHNAANNKETVFHILKEQVMTVSKGSSQQFIVPVSCLTFHHIAFLTLEAPRLNP